MSKIADKLVKDISVLLAARLKPLEDKIDELNFKIELLAVGETCEESTDECSELDEKLYLDVLNKNEEVSALRYFMKRPGLLNLVDLYYNGTCTAKEAFTKVSSSGYELSIGGLAGRLSMLKTYGYVDNPSRSVWKINSKGEKALKDLNL